MNRNYNYHGRVKIPFTVDPDTPTHQPKIDILPFSHTVKVQMGLGPYLPVQTTKVQKDGGKVGKRKEIPKSIKQLLLKRWTDVLGVDTGFKSYAAMRRALSTMRV